MASSGNRYGGTGTPTGAGALSAARAITQEGSGVPSHTAPKNALYRNTATNFLYVNTDGATTWAAVGGGSGGAIATDTIWDALGDTVYGTGADTGAKLAGNITTTRKFLRQVGNGAVSAAPAWDTIADADVPSVHSGSAHHNAVTLNAAADTVLGLSTQQITLDTQTANTVWAGPTSGGAATPTFRALVAADMPSGVVDLTAVDFLVGTATGLLSAEIVVGTSPGGELGGTWASPTIDSVHSGSAHHAAITLDVNADTLLSLSTQALGLDTQTANRILAGPTTGSAAVPTFRALVAADMPSGVVDLTAVDFLVGTATALLSAEIVVGTSPGGELGGTWASPTIDSVHSGSAHHALVTLDVNADTLLSLSTQALGLDTQTANKIFAGPTTGAAVVPTFRSLVAADMPSGIVDLTAVDFLVGTATALLSGEIVVGTSPGGELGGTWASPTVDATHSGSAHHTQGHAILDSTNHTDTLTGTVVDGDVIIGNVTPAWSRLAISVPAANVRNVFGIDNGETRPSWKTALDATNPTSTSTASSPGTSLVFAHRDHVHAIGVLTTKGDLLGWSTLPVRVGVGTDGQVLTADAASTAGWKWAAAAGGAPTGTAGGDLFGTYPNPSAFQLHDTGGVLRVGTATTASPGPNVTVTGGLAVATGTAYIDLNAASPSAVQAGCGLLIGDSADNWFGKMGLGVFMGQTYAALASTVITGIGGKVAATAQGSTSETVNALDFVAGHVAANTGTKTTNGVRVNLLHTGSGATLTSTGNLTYYNTVAATLSGTSTAINIVGVNIAATNNSRLSKWWGTVLGYNVITLANSTFDNATLVSPIAAGGPARTTDTDGSFHLMNFQFGSITRAFAGMNGGIGLTNVTTAPSTTPAGGIVIFATDAQRLMMRGIYAVNETIHTTLTALAAGTAYASSTTETALVNGTFNFPANSLVAGAVYRITARGVISTLTATAPTMQVRMRWGGAAGVLLGDSGAITQGLGTTNLGWKVEFLIRVVSIGATGTLECQGEFVSDTTPVLAVTALMANAAVITIDSTAAKDLTLTATFSANNAANTMTCRQYVCERIA